MAHLTGPLGRGRRRRRVSRLTRQAFTCPSIDSGTRHRSYTALQHSLTCTPLVVEFEWSSILLRASADPISALNRRNRYGSTAAHEQVMTYNRPGEEDIRGQALEFVLARGANVDIVSPSRRAGSLAAATSLANPRNCTPARPRRLDLPANGDALPVVHGDY